MNPSLSRFFWAFFQKHPSPAWAFEQKNFRILDANQAALDIYGYTHDDFTKLTMPDLSATPENRSLFEKTMQSAFTPQGVPQDDNPIRIDLGRWQHYTRERRPILVELTLLCFAFRRRQMQIAVAFDVSRQSADAFSSMLHDLKNPLGVILAYADLLSQECAGNKRAIRQIESIHRAAKRIKELLSIPE